VRRSDIIDKDVHHAKFVAEADQRPQTCRVQRDAVRILGELTVQLDRTATYVIGQ